MPPDPTPAESPAGPTTDSTAATFTVRYHRGRTLTLAAACLAIWCAAQVSAAGLSWPFKDLLLPIIAVGPLSAFLLATASFNHAYLTFDTAERSLHGPGGWLWRRTYPRSKRPEKPSEIHGGGIFATDGDRERRLPFHRFWAHPDDWAQLADLLADASRPVPRDWVRIGRIDPRPSDSGRLMIATDPIRIGGNVKLFRWSLAIGTVLLLASCAPIPFASSARDYYTLMMIPAIAPFILGVLGVWANPVVHFDPWAGTVTTTSRLSGTSVHPNPKFSHLEYSARLGNLYQVRADGKRQMVVNRWAMEPKAWKQFTDRLKEPPRC